jgi:alkylation response protein AidB-like acyl-CoA dehydrogenase
MTADGAMNLEPTMKQAVVRRSVRSFAEKRMAPLAAEMDATARFPEEVAQEMALLDYFGLENPGAPWGRRSGPGQLCHGH